MKGISIRLEFPRDWVFYSILTKVEHLEGINSKLKRKIDQHIILFDFDDMPIKNVMNSLKITQKKYDLGEIFIITDRENSYRAMCFKTVKFIELLKILIDTKGIDEYFIRYTARKGEATIRTTTKKGRKDIIIAGYLEGKYYKPPKTINLVSYISKIGENVKLWNADLRAGDNIG